MVNIISLEKMPYLQFTKNINRICPLISSKLIRVIFDDESETYVITGKRGLVEPRHYRRRRLLQERNH